MAQLAFDPLATSSAGAKAYFYRTGTTRAATTYTDSALLIPHPQPVVADSEGRFAAIYLDGSVTYKVVVKTAENVVILTVDPISGSGSGSQAGTIVVLDAAPTADDGSDGQLALERSEPALWGPKVAGEWNALDRYILTRASSAPIPASANLMGAWNAEDYQSTPVRLIPNSSGFAPAVSTNLIPTPRNAFSNTVYFNLPSTVVTDRYALGPEGQLTASRLQITGAGGIALNASSYSGAHCGRVWLKSNTGSTQAVTILGAAGAGAAFTVPTSWAALPQDRINFTVAGADLFLVQIASGTADVLISGAELYKGASIPAAAHTYGGHMLLGAVPNDTAPAVAAGEVDITTSAYATVQFSSATTVGKFTMATMVKVVNVTGSNHAIFRDFISFTNFYAPVQEARSVGLEFGGVTMKPQNDQEDGAFNLLNTPGYHVITHRYDGTNMDVFVDNWPLYRQTVAISPPQLRDFYAFSNFSSGIKWNASRLWNTNLTDTQVQQAVAYLQTRASLAITPAPLARVINAGGDSISAYPGQFPYWAQQAGGGLLSPGAQITVTAHPAAVLTNIIDRYNTYGTRIIGGKKTGQKAIYTIYNSNDILALYANYGGSRTAWLAALAAHAQQARDDGYIVGVCTILPRSATISATFNTERAIVNPLIRAMVGVSCDFIVDFAADGTMGVDAAADNLTLFPDRVHPNGAAAAAAQTYLTPIWVAAINAQ